MKFTYQIAGREIHVAVLLNISIIITCLLLLVASIYNFIKSFLHISEYQIIIVSFYLIIGSSLIIIGELNITLIYRFIPWLGWRGARGIFEFVVGTLAFALAKGDGIAIDIIMIVLGVVLTVLSILQLCLPIVAVYTGTPLPAGESPPSLFSQFKSANVDLNSVSISPSSYTATTTPSSTYGHIGGSGYGFADPVYNAPSSPAPASSTGTVNKNAYTTDGVGNYVHDSVATAVASAARDSRNQQKVAESISNAVRDTDTQQRIGEYVASTTDQPWLKSLATNSTLQQYSANAFASAAENETLQRMAGDSIAYAAEDKETQRAVAQFAMDAGRDAVKGAVLGVSNASTNTNSSGWGNNNAYVL